MRGTYTNREAHTGFENTMHELSCFSGVPDHVLLRVLATEGRVGRVRQPEFVRIVTQVHVLLVVCVPALPVNIAADHCQLTQPWNIV